MDLDKIIENKGLSELEIRVLKYIIENIEEVTSLGVRGIARNNFTSTSTVMRLAKKMGYSGFLEMQYNLLSLIDKSIDKEIKDIDFIKEFNISGILNSDNKKNIKKFLDTLNNKDNNFIFIYANGFSTIVADYLYKKLLVMGKRCIFSNGTDSVGVFENNLDSISSVIVISKSGETSMVLNKVKKAKENNIKVISFTNDLENSINSISDISFRFEDSNKLDDRNIRPSMFFSKVMIFIEMLIYEYYKEENKLLE